MIKDESNYYWHASDERDTDDYCNRGYNSTKCDRHNCNLQCNMCHRDRCKFICNVCPTGANGVTGAGATGTAPFVIITLGVQFSA